MATISVNQREIYPIVNQARQTLWRARVLLGLLAWLGMCLSVWLVLFWLDNVLHLPAGMRLALSLAGLGMTITLLWRDLLLPMGQKEDPARVALLLERHYGIPQNLLINSLQFEGRQQPGSAMSLQAVERPFAARTILSAVKLTAEMNFRDLWQFRRVSVWLLGVLALGTLWVGYVMAQGHLAGNAWQRFSRPLADIPPVGSVRLEVSPGEAIQIPQGDDLEIVARLSDYRPDALRRKGLRTHPQIVWLEDGDYVSPDSERDGAIAMRADDSESGVYRYRFNRVRRPFAFRVFAADTYSRSIQVGVNTAATMAGSQVWVTPPAYTARDEAQAGSLADTIAVLPGSTIRVRARLSKAAEGLWWITTAGEQPFNQKDEKDWWECGYEVAGNDTWQLMVKGVGIDRRIQIGEGAINLVQDRAPQVAFGGSGNYHADPGERLKLDLTALDDYGLAWLRVTIRPARTEETPTVLKEWAWSDLPGRREALKEPVVFSLDSDRYAPGESYLVEAVGADHCPEENRGEARPVLIQIRAINEMESPESMRDDAAWRELDAAIEAQQSALGTNRNIQSNLGEIVADKKANEVPGLIGQHVNELARRQDSVGGHLRGAWSMTRDPRPQFVQKMKELEEVEHQKVLDLIRDTRFDPQTGAGAVVDDLRAAERLQNYILSRLVALKGDTIQAYEERQAQALGEAGADLAEETLTETMSEKAEIFMAELENFVAGQKTIMHEREMLQERDGQDFSQADEDRFEELAIDQSRLAEILASAVNDFTNLDMQDFGDDAMVHDMKTIFAHADDLADAAEQAADDRQARVDAYRLETQAVEMAEELIINCEATFGGSDDIQFIAEVAEDEQLVAPLAELPTELEDMVGDLATTAEDMRPEVEDIGFYMNSLDHTAGPISDGTIASMSAKGMTGNQKPEDNIIQGRSGAGRSGMADGQMVESVAKDLTDNEYALRERMSGTPLESGQVKDEDVGAQTGGTGLGKTSDQASLFGPGGKLPPQMLERMKAVRQQQQAMLQSANQAIPQLQRHNLSVKELKEAIDALNRFDEALERRDGVGIRSHYSEAVDSLQRSRARVGEQIAIQYRRDTSRPNQLDNLLSQQQGGRYKGYEQMIGAYFEAISKGGEK